MIRLVAIALLLLLAPTEPIVAAPTTGSISGHAVVVSQGKPRRDAPLWVYLQEVPARRHAGNYGDKVTARISQKDKRFDPPYTVVSVGTTVRFPNDDNEEHSVFSPTKDEFDFGRYKPGPGKDHRFLWATEFDIYCDLHRDMWAKVKVVDSPYIAKVGTDGSYSFDNIAPGEYKVVAWTPDSVEVKSDPVTVRAGEVSTVAVELHPQLGHRNPVHQRKDGKPYPPYP